MKILMLTDRLAIGGAETHISELCRALRRKGHEVSLAAATGAFFTRLADEGFRLYPLPLDSKDPRALRRSRQGISHLLDTEHFDIVHAHARLPAFLAAPLCKRRGIPFVCTAHWVFESRGLRGRLSRWGERSFAVSEDVREYLVREYGLAPEQITVIRNGIDTEAFPVRPRSFGGRILHVSRLDAGRSACAEALLSCAKVLAASGLCHSLTIVGDGNRFGEISEEAKRLNSEIGREFIRIVGAVTDVRPFLYEADLFVGVSRAALEAMATGLPVILAGDEGYLSLFGEDTVDAALESNLCCRGTPPLTDEALCQDILSALSEKTLSARGEFCAAFVRRYYDIEDMASATLAVYRTLIKRPPVTVCGYYGKQNTGDEASLSVLLSRLSDEGFSDVCVLGAKKADGKTPILGRDAVLRPRFFSRRGGIFMLGGGNLLQNETSHRSLLYYTQLLGRAKQAGMRTVILGGIGRLDARGERVVRRALRHADGFLLRSEQDVAAARALSRDACPMQLLPDAALWLVPNKSSNVNLPHDNTAFLAFKGGCTSTLAFKITQHLQAEQGLFPMAAVMQAGRDEPTEEGEGTHIFTLPYLPPAELLAYMQSCRVVVGDRLHAIVLAAASGVPAVGISDGGKIDAFCDFCKRRGGAGRITAVPRKEAAICEAIDRALRLPREDGGLLARLREAGENFSFADFFALL